MEYYKLFNLKKDPFSSTPDPDFFFRSTQHSRCLQQAEISVRLRRGLCLVKGRVGTGKTTLCRRLIRVLGQDSSMEVHLMMDPGFEKTIDFAAAICEMLCGKKAAESCSSLAEHREKIQHRLFEAGVDQKKNMVLIIDEGQKLVSGSVEFLRGLLNFETNEHKLLQIVIFAQDEISQIFAAHPNFSDRIGLYYHLQPLDRRETALLIAHRLILANGGKRLPAAPVFTSRAISRIHRISRGYPRKIIHLSYHSMLLLLIKGGSRISPDMVVQASKNLPAMTAHDTAEKKIPWAYAAGIAVITVVMAAIGTTAYRQQPFFKDTHNAPGVLAQSSASEKAPKQTEFFIKKIQPAPDRKQGRSVAAAAKKSEPPEPPAYLGHIRIRTGQRLWDAAGCVYGRTTPAIIEKIQLANPELTDPDKIRVGQKIRLPVAHRQTPDADQLWWIALETSSELEPVYETITHGDYSGLGVLSFWSPDKGICHAAVTKQHFPDPRAAEAAMARLPEKTAARAKLIDLSDGRICLLTYPTYAGNKSVEVTN